jgi:hypothetical protein
MTLIGVSYGTMDGYGQLDVPEVTNIMSTKLLIYTALVYGRIDTKLDLDHHLVLKQQRRLQAQQFHWYIIII